MTEHFKNYICKIKDRIFMGTFCHIKTKNIDVLLTNYIDNNLINSEKLKYTIIGGKEEKEIDMKKDRFKFTDIDLNIAIIEIFKKEDKVSNFIEINEVNSSIEEYINQDIIYFCESSKGFNSSEGKIKDISEKIFFNYKGDLINNNGSPLILKSNSKLIGLNIGEGKALSIKTIINKIKLLPIYIRKNISNINFIKCQYKIEKNNIGKKIQIINNGYKGFSHGKKKELLDMIIEDEDEDEWKEKFMEIKIINDKIKDKSKFLIDEKCYEKELEHKFLEEKVYTVYIVLDRGLDKLNYLFSDCKCLQVVDFCYFNSEKITDMSYMFLNCSLLKKIIFPENFNTKNLRNMNSMFCNCSSLEEIDLTSFNTKKVKDMGCMFSGCNKLKKIIVKSKKSNDKKNETKGIEKKEEIKEVIDQVSTGEKIENSERRNILDNLKFKIKNSKNKKNKKNEAIVLKNNYITTNNENDKLNIITNTSIEHKRQNDENKDNQESKKLEKETSLSIFNTSNVENMSCMFAECTSLEGEVNLAEFKTNNPKDMSFMFYKCKKLNKIKLSLSSDYEVNMKNMFIGCKCEEYILGDPKIDNNKENIFDIFEDIKYFHFRKFKFTSIECKNKELKEIIQIKEWVYICNFILIIFLILSIIVFIILI